MTTQIKCKTCDAGMLEQRRRYRLSGVVAFIGYIILLPSFIGMALGGLALFGTCSAATTTEESSTRDLRVRLEKAGVSEALSTQVAEKGYVLDSQLKGLPESQVRALKNAESSYSAQQIGRGAGVAIMGGVSIGVFALSLVGGLLGWILVMKKSVLECSNCRAIVPTS